MGRWKVSQGGLVRLAAAMRAFEATGLFEMTMSSLFDMHNLCIV